VKLLQVKDGDMYIVFFGAYIHCYTPAKFL